MMRKCGIQRTRSASVTTGTTRMMDVALGGGHKPMSKIREIAERVANGHSHVSPEEIRQLAAHVLASGEPTAESTDIIARRHESSGNAFFDNVQALLDGHGERHSPVLIAPWEATHLLAEIRTLRAQLSAAPYTADAAQQDKTLRLQEEVAELRNALQVVASRALRSHISGSLLLRVAHHPVNALLATPAATPAPTDLSWIRYGIVERIEATEPEKARAPEDKEIDLQLSRNNPPPSQLLTDIPPAQGDSVVKDYLATEHTDSRGNTPAEPLGQRLREISDAALASGTPVLSADEIQARLNEPAEWEHPDTATKQYSTCNGRLADRSFCPECENHGPCGLFEYRCTICGGLAYWDAPQGVWRHMGNPMQDGYIEQGFCDKYGYPINVTMVPIDAAHAVSPAHTYTSTACQHGLHGRCRKNCKFCGTPCLCPCGHEAPSEAKA